MMVRDNTYENIPEEIAAIKLLGSPQADVLSLSEIRYHYPWFGERPDKDLDDWAVKFDILMRDPCICLAGSFYPFH